MPRQFIDLSIPLENDVVSDPPVFAPRIHYIDHQASVAQLCAFFPGLTQALHISNRARLVMFGMIYSSKNFRISSWTSSS